MHTFYYARLEKPTIPLATQEKLPVNITRSIYHYAYAKQTQVNCKKETKNKEEKGKEIGAWGQQNEKKKIFWGDYWRVCHQVTWFFDGLQQYSERLAIHPPKHGQLANYAIDSWLWLSRVFVLGAHVPCLLLDLVWVKHAVCSVVSRQQHTRTSAGAMYHSYRKCNILGVFFFINKNIKRLLYIGHSDACTTTLANGTCTAL